jgi:hypothetical protein
VAKPAYPQGKDGKWCYPTMPVSFVSCCDCGLVHKHIYQITPDDFAVRDSKGRWRYGRRVRVKVSRDYRKTAQVRRGMVKRKELYADPRRNIYVQLFTIRQKKRKRKNVTRR